MNISATTEVDGIDASLGFWAGGDKEPAWPSKRPLYFRAFALLPAARILLRHGHSLQIGSRAFDLLHLLLRSRGELVEHADIVRHVWPTTIVEESNIRVQIASIRKALGEDRDLLKTVPGRGYLLAEDVALGGSEALAEEQRRRRWTADVDLDATDKLGALLNSALEELRELKRDTSAARSPS